MPNFIAMHSFGAEEIRAAADRLGIDPEQYAAHLMLLAPEEAQRGISRVLAGIARRQVERSLVYGELPDDRGLDFIPESRANDLAEVVHAWWNSSTWGELRKRLEARGIAEEFLERFDYPDNYPSDDEPLTDEQKDENTADGDWPAWPAAEMLDWVPKDIATMGHTFLSMVSGPALFFDPHHEKKLVAAFEKHGFTCRRDDELVRATYALS